MQPFWWFKKPAVIPPVGEQIENGGFEDQFDYWEYGINAYIDTFYKRSGNRSLGLTGYSEPENFAWAKQTLGTPVPVAYVSTFKLYGHADWYPAQEKKLLITIGYTDDSSTEVTFTFYETYVWHECDLKPYLSSGKTIKSIRIETLSLLDISVDDVSLIGTG